MLSNFKINDLVEIHSLIKNIELNGQTGKICKDISNNRYGVKLENELKAKLIRYENLTLKIEVISNNTDTDFHQNSEEFPLKLDYLEKNTSDLIEKIKESKIKLESVKHRISKLQKPECNWCLHEDCLLSNDCFPSNESLINHMTIHN